MAEETEPAQPIEICLPTLLFAVLDNLKMQGSRPLNKDDLEYIVRVVAGVADKMDIPPGTLNSPEKKGGPFDYRN